MSHGRRPQGESAGEKQETHRRSPLRSRQSQPPCLPHHSSSRSAPHCRARTPAAAARRRRRPRRRPRPPQSKGCCAVPRAEARRRRRARRGTPRRRRPPSRHTTASPSRRRPHLSGRSRPATTSRHWRLRDVPTSTSCGGDSSPRPPTRRRQWRTWTRRTAPLGRRCSARRSSRSRSSGRRTTAGRRAGWPTRRGGPSSSAGSKKCCLRGIAEQGSARVSLGAGVSESEGSSPLLSLPLPLSLLIRFWPCSPWMKSEACCARAC